jgi:hypothetical protein
MFALKVPMERCCCSATIFKFDQRAAELSWHMFHGDHSLSPLARFNNV